MVKNMSTTEKAKIVSELSNGQHAAIVQRCLKHHLKQVCDITMYCENAFDSCANDLVTIIQNG